MISNTPKSLSNEKLRGRSLLKGHSKKSNPYAMYDESFIRYVNELDSYFKASEMRHQTSQDVAEGTSQNMDHITFTAEKRLSMRRKKFMWNQPSRVSEIPQISLNSFDVSSTDLDTLEVSLKTNTDNASYYTTPDQDVSFMTAPDGQSLCVTPDQATTSDMSCYLTAELNSSLETDTYVYEIANERGSQETLYNDSFDYDDSIDSHESCEASVESSAAKLSLIDLNVDNAANGERDVDGLSQSDLEAEAEDVLCPLKEKKLKTVSVTEKKEISTNDTAMNSTSVRHKLEAKERRSNFVRSTCIDLDDEVKSNDNQDTVIVLDEPEPKKESYLKCCPV